jgi:proline iminopeptidase
VAIFVTSDGTELWYEMEGRGRRVFALPGGPANDHRYLAEDLAPLARDFELVFLDYRGSGQSASASSATYTLEHLADDLEKLRDELGDSQITILGHSMGGYVALSYAVRYPERCDRLVLAGTWPTTVPSRMLPPTFRALGWSRSLKMLARALWWVPSFGWRPHAMEGRRRLYAIWSTMQEGRRPMRARELARERRLGMPLKSDNIRALQHQFRSWDVTDRLSLIRCPTLVLYGERDAAAVAAAKTFTKQLADVDVRVLRDIGHDVFFEAPDASFDAVRSFLGERPTPTD